MKKAIPIIVLLAIIGAGVFAFAYMRNPNRAACVRIGELCGGKDGTKAQLDQCTDQVEQWRKVAGDAPVDKGIACVDGAKTCGEAMGCVAGAGISGFQKVVDDFLKGFGKATQ
ncbi:MAG: hypothetical protein IPM54_45580 [Polyangiaceae bacterium]|nr:hypothetical protein [Polyangiaceae bacterium]